MSDSATQASVKLQVTPVKRTTSSPPGLIVLIQNVPEHLRTKTDEEIAGMLKRAFNLPLATHVQAMSNRGIVCGMEPMPYSWVIFFQNVLDELAEDIERRAYETVRQTLDTLLSHSGMSPRLQWEAWE